MASYRLQVTRRERDIGQDKAQFQIAVRRRREHHELGKRLPLYYTLPTGRSIEAVCERLRWSATSIPRDLSQAICNLADELGVSAKPHTITYQAYSPILNEIAVRLTLPFDQRLLPFA
jgi:hypothetical protein